MWFETSHEKQLRLDREKVELLKEKGERLHKTGRISNEELADVYDKYDACQKQFEIKQNSYDRISRESAWIVGGVFTIGIILLFIFSGTIMIGC